MFQYSGIEQSLRDELRLKIEEEKIYHQNKEYILKKKDILLGRTDLYITDEIIVLVNSKVKKINLN